MGPVEIIASRCFSQLQPLRSLPVFGFPSIFYSSCHAALKILRSYVQPGKGSPWKVFVHCG